MRVPFHSRHFFFIFFPFLEEAEIFKFVFFIIFVNCCHFSAACCSFSKLQSSQQKIQFVKVFTLNKKPPEKFTITHQNFITILTFSSTPFHFLYLFHYFFLSFIYSIFPSFLTSLIRDSFFFPFHFLFHASVSTKSSHCFL